MKNGKRIEYRRDRLTGLWVLTDAERTRRDQADRAGAIAALFQSAEDPEADGRLCGTTSDLVADAIAKCPIFAAKYAERVRQRDELAAMKASEDSASRY